MVKNTVSYIPFARKYRPKNFSELVGQEVLTKTLSYCISNKKLAGALLLTGIRGVGKTSSARIVAKTINCTSLKTHQNSVLPCEKCKNCESFQHNNHPDVIEIDAASRTGVDDVREIIESSEYRPLLGEYKIFIIDEVHMLSKSAFNALLKLIEEPPAHVIFIFATTEAQKIPLTVLSRCQRYDLKRLGFDEILSLLQKIAKDEGIKYEEEALKIIALKSEGSARDGTAILDQASSYIHNKDDNDVVTAGSVNKMLGLVQVSTILKLIQLIIAGNTAGAIKLLEEIYISSNSLEYFIQQVSDFIANLTKEKVIPGFHDPLYSHYSSEITDILVGMSLSRLSILWQIFNNGVDEIKLSHNELVTAQMLVIKAIYSCNLPKIEEILDAESHPDQQTRHPELVSGSQEMKAKMLLPHEIQNQVRDDNNIFDFLKFCHTKNEMGLYYFLLNEVEVKSFASPLIEIVASTKVTEEKALKTMLHKWSGIDWNILFSKQDEIVSLKQKLLEKARISEDFAVIKNHFPNADISDIIFKS
jgi:DNA polymerase-3 subunit gamma/tau